MLVAIDELRQRLPGRSWFLPVLLDHCEIPDLEIGGGKTLRAIHHVDLHADYTGGVERLVAVMCGIATPAEAGGQASALKELRQDLMSPSPRHRLRGVLQLTRDHALLIEGIAPALDLLLVEDDDAVFEHLVYALAEGGAPVLPHLRERLGGELESGSLAGCRRIAQVLSKLGPAAETAIPELIELLKREPEHVKSGAAGALAAIGASAVPAVLGLVSSARVDEYSQPWYVDRAVHILGAIGAPADPAISVLTQRLLEHPSMDARVAAAVALGEIASDAEQVVPALMAAMNIYDGETYPNVTAVWSIRALGNFGPEASRAIPLLVEALDHEDDENGHVRSAAAEVLGRIGAEAVVPLISLLRGPASHARDGALKALAKMGPAAAPALESLIRLARDRYDYLAVEAIAAIGPLAAPAIPLLLQALFSDGVSENRWQGAVKALGTLGPAAAEAVPAVVARLGDAPWPIRERAVAALQEMRPAALPVVEAMLAESADGSTRENALRAQRLLSQKPHG